jgi:hypothetical protein
MRCIVASILTTALLATGALGVTRDTLSFTNVISDGTNGSALNHTASDIIFGTYPVTRIRVNGTLVSGGVNSYASEAHILVTPPSGSPFTLQPFSIPGAFDTDTTPSTGYVFDLPAPVPNAHGAWTFRFYESYDDPGVDATWQNVSFVMEDGTGTSGLEASVTAPPAISEFKGSLISLYVVPGTNPASTNIAVTADLSPVHGSATQTLYDDGTHGDLVAGDHVYSYLCTPTVNLEGSFTINYHVTDAQSRNLTGSFPLRVQEMPIDMPVLNGWQWYTSGLTLSPGGVVWFRFTITDPVSDSAVSWFDTWSDAPIGGDTEIAVYNSSGALIASDDDDGDGLLSALSFGLVSPARQEFTADGVPGNGRDGPLAPGTYYLAYGTFPLTFGATNFTVNGYGPACTNGSVQMALRYNKPIVVGQRTNIQLGGTALITCFTESAISPPSQGITVHADLSAIGGSSNQLMYDDGTHGDLHAGDGTLSFSINVPAQYGEGEFDIPLTVSDSLGRHDTGTAVLSVDLAGDTIATAWPLDGSGSILGVSGAITLGDADMYRIHICDPANFSARVSGGTLTDPQLFLFRPDGTGVVAADDNPGPGLFPVLNGPLATSIPAGDYYIAISGWDKDPLDSSQQLLWDDAFYWPIHAPDGPGEAHPLAGWNDSSGEVGTYVISFTGVGGTACRPHCGSADFNCDGDVGTDADIEAFFHCLAGACPPPPCTSTADFNGDGDVGTDADIEAFFRVLAGGTC